MKLLGFFDGKSHIVYVPEEDVSKYPREPIDFYEIPRFAVDQRKETKDGYKSV